MEVKKIERVFSNQLLRLGMDDFESRTFSLKRQLGK